MTCKQCRWLDAPLDKIGRRVVRADNAYECTAPNPDEPKLPASVERSWGAFIWPPLRIFMCGSMGQECSCFEELP